MAKPKATHHAVFIVAHIHGPEVADMLRYDSAIPATEKEAHKMVKAMAYDKPDWIIFRRFVALGARPEPTHERWRSFNIKCLPQAFNDFYEAERAVETIKRGAEKLVTSPVPA